LSLEGGNKLSLPKSWPNPKLRALEEITQSDAPALRWVRPSIPWWPLRGAWADIALEPNLLIF
jgi:hypothetical protein